MTLSKDLHFLCVWPTIKETLINVFPTPNGKAKVWDQKPFCFRVTVYLSVWHSTFETHNHKTKIYRPGSGSTSVSLVFTQQLPTGQSRKKHHESRFANMLELESFVKKEHASRGDSIAAGRVQKLVKCFVWCLNKVISTGADISTPGTSHAKCRHAREGGVEGGGHGLF